ncbi:tape measure protein [Paucibacter sp. PLA-PC-4]|uniref:tape measure protein n=1 Tax=Paucibacter sp. PLA-PC-4 TaxID=2993655 RepID=UPI00224A5F27|nr:tape measure protein [Paucibacter sp. PLA-PC-4]MCX2863736.1 tape measure protein [Paucibacter sp. PLA-PC-4]
MNQKTTRDVTLGVGIKTTGEEALRSLSREVLTLAKRGGDAAPAYQQLANELDRLAAQAGQLQTFKQLSAEVEDLGASQRTAAAAAEELRTKLDAQRSAVQQATEAQARAKTEYRAAQDALQGQRLGLEQLNAQYTRAEREQASYISQSQAFKNGIVAAKDALYQKRQALNDSNDAVRAAETAETALEKSYNRAARAASDAAASLQEHRSAMQQAGAAAESLGADISDVAAAEQRLLQVQQQLVGSVADQRTAAIRAQSEADREAIQLAQGKAEQLERGRQALAAELAAIREAEQASESYNRAKREGVVWAEQQIAAEREGAAALNATAAAATKANEAALAASGNADRVRFWAESFDQLAAAEQRAQQELIDLAAAAKRAEDALRDAFGQTGVRSLKSIDDEVFRLGESLGLLQRQYRAGAIGADDLARATSSAQVRLAQLKREAATIPSLPGAFERISSSVGDLINRFGALGAAIATVGVAVKPVIDATIELERMNRVLTTVLGSSSAAAREIEFLRGVAQRSGQAFSQVGDSYSKFAAAAVNSGVPLATVNRVFENTALAAGNLGLSSDQTTRILGALGQMASKGTVQMEELRGQLGDALPGALALMAKGLGLTEQELGKLVESGNLLASDALPALADALVQLAPKDGQGVTGLVAEFNRLKNVVLEASTILTGGAFGQGAAFVLDVLSGAVQRVAFGAALIGESFTVTGRQIGATVAAIVNRDFSLLNDELARIEQESTAKLANLASRIGDSGTAAAGATPAVTTLADRVAAVAQASDAAAAGTTAAGTAAAESGDSWVKLSVAMGQQLSAAEKAATVAGKLTEAKKTEAAAAAEIIAISGDEKAAKDAASAAADRYADALQAQADTDARVATVLRSSIEALEARATAENRLDEATKKRLADLKQDLAGKEADAEKTRQQADAARVHAAALDVQALSLRDNSGRLVEYRAAVQQAQLELDAMIRAFGRDKATKDDVRLATEALARAQGLLKDAVSDTARAVEHSIQIQKLDHQIRRAGIQAQLDESRASEILASARGDELTASREVMKQKELEILLSKDRATQKVEEARLRKEAAEAELRDTQNLPPEKERELLLRIKIAEAMEAEAKANGAVVKVKQAETEALRQRLAVGNSGGGGGANANGGTRVKGAPGPGNSATAGEIDGSGMGSFNAGLQPRQQLGGAVDASYVFDLQRRAQLGQLTAEDLAGARKALEVAQANARLGAPGSVSLEGRRDDSAWVNRLRAIVEQLESAASGAGLVPKKSTNPTASPAASSTSYTVNVNLGNRRTSIDTATASDADKLADLFRRLEDDMGRAM